MNYQNQQGVSLIIIFLIMTIIVAVVVSISTILYDEVKIISGIGRSVFSFYAIDTGIEKTLYFDRKAVSIGANRGFCNICTSCNDPSIDPVNYCNNCILTPTAQGGCDPLNCQDCQVDYTSVFDQDVYTISATIPSIDPAFDMDIKGYYKDVLRSVQLK